MDKPQVPRPDHRSAFGDGDDGVAVLDTCSGYFELNKGITAGIVYNRGAAELHKACFICPNHLGTVYTAVCSAVGLLYPRVGDVLVVVVFKMP